MPRGLQPARTIATTLGRWRSRGSTGTTEPCTNRTMSSCRSPSCWGRAIRRFVEGRPRSIGRGRCTAAHGQVLPGCETEAFWRRVKSLAHAKHVVAASPLLDELAMLEDLIASSDKRLDALASEHPVASRLMSVPGVGPIVALNFYVKIGDTSRFGTAHQLESYLGLVPEISVSGGPGKGHHITKRGSREVRRLLIQAAWAFLKSGDSKAVPLREWFLRAHER